jgi:pSer/pThr/pTyr-binding forkhead associated (FHA) protein
MDNRRFIPSPLNSENYVINPVVSQRADAFSVPPDSYTFRCQPCCAAAMIVCPNCNHHNPEGAQQCEACYTPLPALSACSHCGAAVQSDANFCGQCGADLKVDSTEDDLMLPTALEIGGASGSLRSGSLPRFDQAEFDAIAFETATIDRSVADDSIAASQATPSPNEPNLAPPNPAPPSPPPPQAVPRPASPVASKALWEAPAPERSGSITEAAPAASRQAPTQLQLSPAKLVHLRSDRLIDLPGQFTVLHVGKPNDRVPPDIDVSGYADAEVVSRVHADIRQEGDAYFLEDVGSANGTYVNNQPLLRGNRHRLRSGDRISFGKGDLVAFVFQLG